MVPALNPNLLTATALLELDKRLPAETPLRELLVVGGFALQIWGIRSELDEATDVDYIGSPVTDIKGLIDAIGFEFGLGNGWLNNDILLSVDDSISELEVSTGKLEFVDVSNNLKHFKLKVATLDTLLRLKLIAIDTSVIAGNLDVRQKDIPDVERVISRLNLKPKQLRSLLDDLADRDLVAEPDEVMRLLNNSLFW